jgi:hypothetical protein
MQKFDRSDAVKKASELLGSEDGALFAVRLLHPQGCPVLDGLCPTLDLS